MENNNEKKTNKISYILIGIIIGLIVSIIGIVIYKFILTKEDPNINKTKIPIKHGEVEQKEDNDFVLDTEDVKKWLDNNNSIINLYYIISENDFDYNNVKKEQYSDFLGYCLLFGGLAQKNSIENITLNDGKYNYQYAYPIDFIKYLLNSYFNVGLEMIDLNMLNNNYKDFANFSMDKNKFTIKVIATGLDVYTSSKLIQVFKDNDNNIVVRYELLKCLDYTDNCETIGHRELLLKKINDGYNILKAYKVD